VVASLRFGQGGDAHDEIELIDPEPLPPYHER